MDIAASKLKSLSRLESEIKINKAYTSMKALPVTTYRKFKNVEEKMHLVQALIQQARSGQKPSTHRPLTLERTGSNSTQVTPLRTSQTGLCTPPSHSSRSSVSSATSTTVNINTTPVRSSLQNSATSPLRQQSTQQVQPSFSLFYDSSSTPNRVPVMVVSTRSTFSQYSTVTNRPQSAVKPHNVTNPKSYTQSASSPFASHLPYADDPVSTSVEGLLSEIEVKYLTVSEQIVLLESEVVELER
eukprot:gene26329-32895_t